MHSWKVDLGLNARLLEAICMKQDSKGVLVHVPSRCNPLRWVENQWQWWWTGEGMDRIDDGGDGQMEQQGMDSSGKGAPAYLVIALIPVYSTLFLMAPHHLDCSKLMVLDLHYIMTD